MGYDLHIHRAATWHGSEARPITRDEWRALVAADPDLRPDPDRPPDGDYEFALWAGPCKYPGGTWFAWSAAGRIHTKNPDRPTAAKMIEMALSLGARVQGDHGEWYNVPEDMPTEEQMAADLRPGTPAGCVVAGVVGFVLGVLAVIALAVVGAITVVRWALG